SIRQHGAHVEPCRTMLPGGWGPGMDATHLCKRPRIVATVLVICSALAACGQLEKGARQYFVDKYSCPETRVTVTEMRDSKPTQVSRADWHAATPPDEVKDDPERLAQWRAKEDERRQNWEAYVNSSSLFALSGCGHRLVLACSKPTQGSSPGSTAICDERP